MQALRKTNELLTANEAFVLVMVVAHSGSALRSIGSRVIVRSDGSIIGTVGGGALEVQVIEAAREIFETKRVILREFMLPFEDKDRLGPACGGKMEVLMHYLDTQNPTQTHLYQEIAAAVVDTKKSWLITRLPADSQEDILEQVLVKSDGSTVGTAHLISSELEDLLGKPGGRWPSCVYSDGKPVIVEVLANQGIVYLFGAGQIAQALAPLTAKVGFKTVILDDRQEFAIHHRDYFDTADDILLLESFCDSFQNLDVDNDSYLIIATRAHVYDRNVLAQALKTGAGYIGMIGSKRKRDAIFEDLFTQGHSQEDLARIHSPIGIKIGAEGPEEIAVSIVAELIQERAGRRQ